MFAIAYKWKSENKKENKIIMDSVKENYSQTGELKGAFEKRVAISTFNQNLKSRLQSRRSQIIRASNLDARHKSILKYWAKLIEDLSFEYYYNEYRGISYEMKDFLEVELEEIENSIKAKILHDIQESKVIKYDSMNNETRITFYAWITDVDNRKPFAKMELLKIVLEHNGFDNPDNENSPNFIDTMDEHLKYIMELYIKEVRAWNKIIEPVKKTLPYDYRKEA